MTVIDVLETLLPLCLARLVFDFAKEEPTPFRAPMFCVFPAAAERSSSTGEQGSPEDRQDGFGDYAEDLFTLPGLAVNF